MSFISQITNFVSDYFKSARLMSALERNGYRRADFESPNTDGEYGLIPNISYVKVTEDVFSPCRRTMDYYTFIFNNLDISVLHGSRCHTHPAFTNTIWLDAETAYTTFMSTWAAEAREKG